MKRVIFLTVLLIGTYVFEFLLLNPGNVADEIHYYKEPSKISVTNPTIYKEDLKHYYETLKTLDQADFENIDESISSNTDSFVQNFNSSINEVVDEINLNLLFYNFNKFRDSNNGIKGIYVNGYHMNNEEKVSEVKEILKNTNVNTLVIDAKTDNGHIMFKSNVPEVAVLNNERIKYDATSLNILREIKEIYLIARIVVFQDPIFAKKFNEEAVYDSKSNNIYSQDGQYFLDPSSELVREYITELSIEACRLGFNEIQFDYIRYPDSNYQFMVFEEESNYENRINNINTFLREAKEALHKEGCLVSADIFGYVLTNKSDGGIGQNLETIVENVDFISPMVYPSHYSNGSFGYTNPNNHPYSVVTNALEDGLKRGVSEEQLRPYLQGFWHTIQDVRENIKAAEDKQLDWLIWNNLTRYELDYFTKLES